MESPQCIVDLFCQQRFIKSFHFNLLDLLEKKYLGIPSANELSPLLRPIILLITKGSPHTCPALLSYEKFHTLQWRDLRIRTYIVT